MSGRRRQLAEARRAAGYSQESLAEQLGVDRCTVQRWEAGDTSPQPSQQLNLATVLGIGPDELAALLHAPLARSSALTSLVSTDLNDHLDLVSRANLLELLDDTRLLVDTTLTTGMNSTARLELIEERVAAHVMTYTRTAPGVMLSALTPDLLEVQSLAAARQPALVQTQLSESLAVLALLTADGLMKMGEIGRSRYWYGSARLAADDTTNLRLRACVRAQEAMLPYYYGRVEDTLTLARSAQALLPGTPCDATALAAAAEGRALARLGDIDGAEAAMATAEHYVEARDDTGVPAASDAAFRFNHKRLLLYLSGTLTYMDQTARARRVQDEALRLYSTDPALVIDPALIRLDQAVGEAGDGQLDDACQLAIDVVTTLPPEHRTRIVLRRAVDVVQTLPEARRQLPRATELRELVAAQAEGS